jgi:hypothetical protein
MLSGCRVKEKRGAVHSHELDVRPDNAAVLVSIKVIELTLKSGWMDGIAGINTADVSVAKTLGYLQALVQSFGDAAILGKPMQQYAPVAYSFRRDFDRDSASVIDHKNIEVSFRRSQTFARLLQTFLIVENGDQYAKRVHCAGS